MTLYDRWLECKKRNGKSITFIRINDFYETFDDDAKLTSEILDLVLVQHKEMNGMKVPMCGFPFRMPEKYFSILIDKGYGIVVVKEEE